MRPELRSDARPGLRSVAAAPRGVVFGDPHVTPEGTTLIEVSRVRRQRGGEDRVSAVGVYAVKDGQALWSPAVDADRIALIGVTTGFVAAVLGCVAVIRRPPWPALGDTVRAIRER